MLRRRWHRVLMALVAAVLPVLLAGALAAGGAGAAAGDDPDPGTTTTVTDELPRRGIIPRPDSGAPARDPGDRGGAAQLAVLGAIVAGVGALVALGVRESRRARAARDR